MTKVFVWHSGVKSAGGEANCFASLLYIDFVSPTNSHNLEVCLMISSEFEYIPLATMSPPKDTRLMPKIKTYVWLAIVLVVVLCTPAEAKDAPVSSAALLHRYCSHLFLRSFLLSDSMWDICWLSSRGVVHYPFSWFWICPSFLVVFLRRDYTLYWIDPSWLSLRWPGSQTLTGVAIPHVWRRDRVFWPILCH